MCELWSRPLAHTDTQIFLFRKTVLVSDQQSDSNKQKIDSVRSQPCDMRKVCLIFSIEIAEYLQNFGQVSK